MTITSVYAQAQFTGNAVTKGFPFPYPFFAPSDLVVILYDTAAKALVVPQPVLNGGGTYDYTVAGTIDANLGEYLSGTVTLNNAPLGNHQLTIQRAVPATQPVQLANTGPFPAKTIEAELDRLTMLVQQAAASVGRALQIPASDPPGALFIPPVAQRAGQFLTFDSQGNPMAGGAIVGTVPVSPAMQPVVAAATVTLALQMLGVSVAMTPVVQAASIAVAATLLGISTGMQPVVAAPSPAAALTLMGGQPTSYPPTNGVSRVVQEKLQSVRSILDYLTAAQRADVAASSKTLDLSAAIQAAFNDAGLVDLYFEPGAYRLDAPVVINRSSLRVRGAGRYATIFCANFAGGHAMGVGNGSNNPGYVTICGVGFAPMVTQTGGAAIAINNGHDIRISDLLVTAGFIGVFMEGGAGQYQYTLDNFEIGFCTNAGVLVGNNSRVQDAWILRGEIASCGNGVQLGNASGVTVTDVDTILAVTAGVMIYPQTAGSLVTAVFMKGVASDTSSGGSGFYFGGPNAITNVTMVGCWSCTNKVDGIYINNANLNGLSIEGSIVMNNQNHGIEYIAGTNVLIEGNQIFCNSQSGSGLYNGIYMSGGQTGFTIQGNSIGNGGSVAGLNKQAYGIYMAAGATGYYAITGNIILGNVTGAIADGSSGPNRIIQENVGFVSQTAGQAQINSGSTQVVVNHGLGAAPAAQNVMVCPASGLGAASTFYVGTVTATTFTIYCNVNPAGTIFFNWWARIATP